MAEQVKETPVSPVKREIIKIEGEELVLRKRLPSRLPKRANDVYVNNKTDFKAQLARCFKILDSNEDCIYVHGLGAAIPKAINLALQLQQTSKRKLEIAVNTGTVDLIDDFQPQNEAADHQTQTRQNSSIHIKIYSEESEQQKNENHQQDVKK